MTVCTVTYRLDVEVMLLGMVLGDLEKVLMSWRNLNRDRWYNVEFLPSQQP